ncbi:hypothetical protein [Enterococcus italicus]
MTMTIKELADTVGVSKQAIMKRINNLPDNLQPTKVKGVYSLNDDTVAYILAMYHKVVDHHEPLQSTDNQQKRPDDSVEIERLKEQIEDLKRDKELLHEHISSLTESMNKLNQSLQQEQAISYESTKKSNQLQLELQEEKIKGFWKRIFGR